jgi:plasmid stability protein
MATLKIENLPDDLVEQLEQLADRNARTLDDLVVAILKRAVQQNRTDLKFFISPETDPTWFQRCKAVPQVLAEIEQRRKERRTDVEWLDSKALLREDRDR